MHKYHPSRPKSVHTTGYYHVVADRAQSGATHPPPPPDHSGKPPTRCPAPRHSVMAHPVQSPQTSLPLRTLSAHHARNLRRRYPDVQVDHVPSLAPTWTPEPLAAAHSQIPAD